MASRLWCKTMGHAAKSTFGITPTRILHRLQCWNQAHKVLSIDTQKSFGWYDFTIRSGKGSRFEQRFSGHAETGQWSTSDPAMG